MASSRPIGQGLRKRRALTGAAFLSIVLLAVGGELFLREHYGLGTPLIFERDAVCGYRTVPGQNIRRFGNNIYINACGLRNQEITANATAGITRILCLGDSVTNGGSLTDQTETLTAWLERMLNRKEASTHAIAKQFQVLNASAGGWAIGNELGFLKEFGDFNSSQVLLILNHGDYCQSFATSGLVDLNPGYPSRRPMLAWQDLIGRYLLPRLLHQAPPADPGAVRSDNTQVFQENINLVKQMDTWCRRHHTKLRVIAIGASKHDDDIETRPYERQFALAMAQTGIPLYYCAIPMNNVDGRPLHRDGIHPSPLGNKMIAAMVAAWISSEHS